ncbi:hypothetical protein B0H63DRAFT_393450 [Podospora didyma]|uniref:Uncharacterized protein n=1 Tax=Podospora didyma TaxID=330526 RepID=A0AAE0TZ16_9PEZI|nr:hypothetical protein B0H63DRAFT_393450 [Podospora didyma]
MDYRPHYERRGPQIYVHVEFGVSWSRKNVPKNHEMTYKSRNLRERPFPRQVPAPNTNYLAAIRAFEERQKRAQQGRHLHPNTHNHAHHNHHNHPNGHHQMQEYYQAGYLARGRDQRPVGHEQTRQTRAETGPSYERGRSAPPPIGENPWDVSVQQRQEVIQQSSRAAEYQQQPDQMKALPAEPSQYRLGEDGLPWSAWAYPEGYNPDSYPQDDEQEDEEEERMSAHAVPGTHRHETYATSPTMVSVFSPGPSLMEPHFDEPTPIPATTSAQATTKGRDLGALSAAMMTVDNGFENQWWYQGGRETVSASEPPQSPTQNRFSIGSLPEPADEDEVEDLNSFAVAVSHVSPLTGSPRSTFLSLTRTMSTRSEELWLSERGRMGTF